jgi:hypothetical protein
MLWLPRHDAEALYEVPIPSLPELRVLVVRGGQLYGKDWKLDHLHTSAKLRWVEFDNVMPSHVPSFDRPVEQFRFSTCWFFDRDVFDERSGKPEPNKFEVPDSKVVCLKDMFDYFQCDLKNHPSVLSLVVRDITMIPHDRARLLQSVFPVPLPRSVRFFHSEDYEFHANSTILPSDSVEHLSIRHDMNDKISKLDLSSWSFLKRLTIAMAIDPTVDDEMISDYVGSMTLPAKVTGIIIRILPQGLKATLLMRINMSFARKYPQIAVSFITPEEPAQKFDAEYLLE